MMLGDVGKHDSIFSCERKEASKMDRNWREFFAEMDAWRLSDALREFQAAEGTGETGKEWMHDVVTKKQAKLLKKYGLDPADLRNKAAMLKPLPVRKTRMNPDLPAIGSKLPRFPLLDLAGTPVSLPEGPVAVIAGSLT
jgi:hypothetical protein